MVYYFKVLFQYILVRNHSIKTPHTTRYVTLTFVIGSWDLPLYLTEFKDPWHQKVCKSVPLKFCKNVGQILESSSNCFIFRNYKHRGKVEEHWSTNLHCGGITVLVFFIVGQGSITLKIQATYTMLHWSASKTRLLKKVWAQESSVTPKNCGGASEGVMLPSNSLAEVGFEYY